MPDRRQDQPRYLLPVLVALIAIGVVSVMLTLQQGREAQFARAAQVDEVNLLVGSLTEAQEARNVTGRAAHEAICNNVAAIAEELNLDVQSCPDLQGDPANGNDMPHD